MNVIVKADNFGGSIEAIPSKSYAHRQLICAALSKNSSKIKCRTVSKDITATVECLNSLGANIKYTNGIFDITPVDRNNLPEKARLDVGESGSTFRFMIPIVCALGVDAEFILHGRLPERPLTPLYEELIRNGISLSEQGSNPFCTHGKLNGKEYQIPANVSSQFISGILLALPIIGGGSIELLGDVQSASYINITLECMKKAGIDISYDNNIYTVNGCYKSEKVSEVEGDWSNAAFWLCAGAIAKEPVTVTGLNMDSSQGDKKVIEVLKRFGGRVFIEKDKITTSCAQLNGIDIDASDIPDLIPVLSVVAACASGKTQVYNAGRLRIKESDRIESTCDILNKLGVKTEQTKDSMTIYGSETLKSCTVDGWNDHRIAMMAAISSVAVLGTVIIKDAHCVNKSYPDFFKDFDILNGVVEEE